MMGDGTAERPYRQLPDAQNATRALMRQSMIRRAQIESQVAARNKANEAIAKGRKS
jgi:hypothetical protein